MHKAILSLLIVFCISGCSSSRQNPKPELPRKFVGIGNYEYELRSEIGYALPLIYRQIVGQTSQVLVLNPNLGFAGWTPKAFGSFRISADQNVVAFSVDLLGDGDFRLFVETIGGSREVLPLQNVSGFEWIGQTKNLLVLSASAGRPQDVFFVTETKSSRQIFHEADPATYLQLISGQLEIGLHANHPLHSRAYLFKEASAEFAPIFANCPDLLEFDLSPSYAAGICWDKKSTKLLESKLSAPNESLVLYTPSGTQRYLRNLRLLPDRTAVSEHGDGLTTLLIFDRSAKQARRFDAPDLYSELKIRPDKVDLMTNSFRANSYQRMSLEYAPSVDGVLVPLTVLYGSEPTTAVLLRVYGAYGAETLPNYEARWEPLLYKGVAIATCHARGGGFYGPPWHSAALKTKKSVTTDDFLACQKFLASNGYGKIIAYGKSAGAVPIANAMIRDPQAFAGILLDAPFLSIESTLLDPKMDHNPREYFEWGDPRISEELRAIRSIDPANIATPAKYPPIFITARRADRLVRYKDAELWIEKVKRLSSGPGPYLSYISEGISHAGEDNYYDDLSTEILRRQFILDRIN